MERKFEKLMDLLVKQTITWAERRILRKAAKLINRDDVYDYYFCSLLNDDEKRKMAEMMYNTITSAKVGGKYDS